MKSLGQIIWFLYSLISSFINVIIVPIGLRIKWANVWKIFRTLSVILCYLFAIGIIFNSNIVCAITEWKGYHGFTCFGYWMYICSKLCAKVYESIEKGRNKGKQTCKMIHYKAKWAVTEIRTDALWECWQLRVYCHLKEPRRFYLLRSWLTTGWLGNYPRKNMEIPEYGNSFCERDFISGE